MRADFFFAGWTGLVRTAVVGVTAYVILIVFLRVSGKRSLSKMNAFDFVITVALGSTMATVLLDQSIALAQGVLAFVLLLGLQYAVTWSSVRAPWVKRVVTGNPTLLVHRGEILRSQMRAERVTEEELQAAVRAGGVGEIAGAESVVLETDGSFSVVARSTGPAD
ncbi:MAG: DUF421 domain-containing protein [Gemmatimonadota bacterium]|nr:DUF421 domain-containing protein [Gemmatimonadota bacterium]